MIRNVIVGFLVEISEKMTMHNTGSQTLCIIQFDRTQAQTLWENIFSKIRSRDWLVASARDRLPRTLDRDWRACAVWRAPVALKNNGKQQT